MGAAVSRDDFEWVYTQEPHASRRKAMLKKYPELKKLMGPDPSMAYTVICMVLVQCVMFWLLRDSSIPVLLMAGYCFGGIINHSLTLAIHDISHNAVFGNSHPIKNRLFGMFANLPIGFPYSVAFKRYHTDHHKFQAMEVYDPDIPSPLEVKLFRHTWTKLIWLFFYPYIYLFRPVILNPKQMIPLEALNIVVQLVFNYIVVYFCGARILIYMIFGTTITMGLHPQAGHFIAEHYMFQKGHETYSYRGPWNWFTFNVGYHMEHHDFPNIPGSRLPDVYRIAKDFYEDIPEHPSYCKVLYDFVTNPDLGLQARIVRKIDEKRFINNNSHKRFQGY